MWGKKRVATKFLALGELAEGLSHLACFDEARDYILQAEEMDADEILGALLCECLVFRLFSSDTGYYFAAPIPLSDSADTGAAYSEIYAYCLRECIPAVVVGVPEEDLPFATDGMTSAQVCQMSEDEYLVSIVTECMRCERLPEAMQGRVYLGEFAVSYAEDYARLVEDKELNKYYGYDVTEDVKADSPADYVVAVREEFERGESVTLAATVLGEEGENVFIGEGVLYAFDGRGGASFAFRVLPEYQGQGFGKEIFLALCRVAEEIGLVRISSDVMAENKASLRLLSHFAKPRTDKDAVRFDVRIPFI
jgi:RimJ/RimL family protein N-acetyltransferase